MRNRSWRRAQRERVIANTRRWMKDNGWFTDPFTRWDDAEGAKRVRKTATAPHVCSSYCCGNPRKWFGEETHQEVLSRMKQRDDY
jgi:hypothetical protein